MRWAIDGPIYAPFCGDGDLLAGGSKPGALAHEKYGLPSPYPGRFAYAADIDPVRVADCDVWPFADVNTGPIAVADFDAWAEPWPSFRSFWQNAEKAGRVVLVWTDAHRLFGWAWRSTAH
jgi:hypothetical protein